MIEYKDLFNFKKDCLFQALQRNLELAMRTNEIEMQAKKWCIAYCLIYVGFFVKEPTLNITWLQILIGVFGIFFFLAWELVTHYFTDALTQDRFKLNQSLALLPSLSREELLTFDPLPTQNQYALTRARKLFVILSMLGHETLLYFYFGLALFMLIALAAIRHYR